MVFDPQTFQVLDAISTGQDIYEVPFNFWGVRTVAAAQAAVNPNFQFPPPGQPAIPATIAGIAIGPRSTVDRAWVSWNRLKALGGQGGAAFLSHGQGGPTTRVRPLSIQHPLMFSQATAVGALPTAAPDLPNSYNPNNSPGYAMQQGLLYVFPKEPAPIPASNAGADFVNTFAQSTTVLPANYADQAGNVRVFGLDATFTQFQRPFLELYLYLKPPAFAPPTARFPLFISDTITVNVTGSFQLVELTPIFGRKHVTVGARGHDPAGTATFQLGLINCVRENAGITTSPPFELPGGTSAALAAGATCLFQLANPCADYLAVYAKVQNNTTVDVQISAYD